MKTVCEKNKCTSCMACVNKCPKGAIHIEDSVDVNNAIIDEKICVGCNACSNMCQVNNPLELREPKYWLQGWSTQDSIRGTSSSGGAATAIMTSFIEDGGTVCACAYDGGVFGYKIAETIGEIKAFVGSKYVKSDPTQAYGLCIKLLKKGRRVLFIGLPCQVAGIKGYLGDRYNEQIVYVELICHGSPSPKVLDSFLKSKGITLASIDDIKFRRKEQFHLYADSDKYNKIVPDNIQDFYTFTFLKGITYTENCYECAYAKTERVADITLGDSWGSDLSVSEKKKGISLILCQSEKGFELVKKAKMHIEPVNREKSIRANRQLVEPTRKPEERSAFFMELKKYGFTRAIIKTYPTKYAKYLVRYAMSRLGLG